MNKLTSDEKFIKDRIDAFEYPYNDVSWLELEKSLRKKSFFKFLKWAAVVSFITSAVISVIFIIPENKEQTPETSFISNTNKLNNFNGNQTVEHLSYDESTDMKNPSIYNPEQSTYNNTAAVTINNFTTVNNDSIRTNIDNNDKVSCTHSKSPCPDFSTSETSGCSPLTVIFIPAEKCDSMIYSWDFGDGKISTEKQPVHSFKKSGKYTVRLMVKYFRSDEIKTRVIENAVMVYSKTESDFDISVNNNSVFVQTASQDNKFTWIANDTVSSGNTAERVYMKNGKYEISLITQNNFGCSDTITKKVEIDVPLKIYMPNAFTPFNEGPNKVFGPFTDNSAITNYQIEIINSRGQVVFRKTGKEIDWNGLNQQSNQPCEPGIYYYKLKAWDKFGNFEQLNGNVTLK